VWASPPMRAPQAGQRAISMGRVHSPMQYRCPLGARGTLPEEWGGGGEAAEEVVLGVGVGVGPGVVVGYAFLKGGGAGSGEDD